MLTALSAEAYKNVQTNAGVFLIGVDPKEYETLEEFNEAVAAAIVSETGCLGATRGGGTFNVSKESRVIDADGRRFGFKGDRVVDSVDAVMSTTLLEVTAENFKKALGAADVEDGTWNKKIAPRTNYEDEDYIPVLTWVGDTNYGFLAIVMYNALNTADLNYTFTDKGEGTLPVEFHAHQEDVMDYDTPPFAVYAIERNAAA